MQSNAQLHYGSVPGGSILHIEAMANQRAAVFYLNDSKNQSASEYMVKFMEWGALAISEYINRKQSYLFYDPVSTSSKRQAIERGKRYNKHLAKQSMLAQKRIPWLQKT